MYNNVNLCFSIVSRRNVRPGSISVSLSDDMILLSEPVQALQNLIYSLSNDSMIDWLIDWLGFYNVSAILQPYNGGITPRNRGCK